MAPLASRRVALKWILLLACASACASVACSRRSSAPTDGASDAGAGLAKVTFALDWVPEPEFGGFYAAREGGAFARAGLDVDIQGGGAGAPVVQRVAAGQVDFGIAGADEIVMARARGADVVPVFATFQTSPQAIMTPKERGAASLRDVLSSGTLAIEPGLPYAAFLKKKYGGFGAKVVPYDGGVARFLVEKDFAQQCFVTSEPLLARKKGREPQVFLVADEGFNPYTGVVIVARKALAAHPERVKAFVTAAREGWKAYLADPAAANAVMRTLNPAMDAETFAAAAAAQKTLVAPASGAEIGAMTAERWDTLGRQLVDLGIVPNAPAGAEMLGAPSP
jgi:NitT/TauT family transport system substrate-binding protein